MKLMEEVDVCAMFGLSEVVTRSRNWSCLRRSLAGGESEQNQAVFAAILQGKKEPTL